jgi:hypothetical protein
MGEFEARRLHRRHEAFRAAGDSDPPRFNVSRCTVSRIPTRAEVGKQARKKRDSMRGGRALSVPICSCVFIVARTSLKSILALPRRTTN